MQSEKPEYLFYRLGEGRLIIIKTEYCFKYYEPSIQFAGLISLSLPEAKLTHKQIINELEKEKEIDIKSKKTIIKSQVIKNEISKLELTIEKRASCWLSAVPLSPCHYHLTKASFLMALLFALVESQ